MTDKVVVRFLKAWRGYSADELAAFNSAVVEGLEAKGFAEVYENGEPASKGKGAKGKGQRSTGVKTGETPPAETVATANTNPAAGAVTEEIDEEKP